MRWYHINKEQLTVPSEGPSPCKTKSTAREIHKFGTPMAEPECALTHAVTSFNQILPEFVRFQNQTESNVRIKATEKIISILWGEVRQLRQIGGQQVEAAYCARRKLLRVKQGEMLASHCVKYCEEAHGSHYDILAIIVFSTGCRSLLCGVQRLCLSVSDLAF